MIPLPDPLHPAIVHFPIALILSGAVVAVVAVFVRRWHLPLFAAGLLAVGAAGAVAATWSGGNDEESLGELTARADEVLEEHEEWGERTRNIAIVAAVLAIVGASLGRYPKAARGVGVAAALAAVAAAYAVAETGHYGGQLVYKHGAGVNTAAGSRPVGEAPAGIEEKKPRQDKDDD